MTQASNLAIGGSNFNATGKLSLTTGVTGILPAANGGTGGTSGQVYPGAGIANSTGSAWGTSYTTTGTGTVLALATSPTFVTPALGTPASGTLTNCTFPTLNQNTTGTAAGLSATLAVASGGTGVTTSTGTGNNVLSTSPTLVTPALGTPSSGTLTNCTFPTLNQNTTGSSGSCTGNAATATTASNATTAGGFTPSQTNGTANRIVVADAGGYINNNYFNSSDNVATGMTYVMGKFGDNYLRSAAASTVASFISGQTMNIAGSSTSCSGNSATATNVAGSGITGSRGIPKAAMPAGAILQVVQGTLTSIFSTTAGANSPAAIGLSASITPTSSTSKILVTCYFGAIGSSSPTTYGLFLFRGATKICFGDAYGSADRGAIGGGNDGGYRAWPGSIVFLDSPATTSATTYSVSFGGNGGVTAYINSDGRLAATANNQTTTASTITLMEVAA